MVAVLEQPSISQKNAHVDVRLAWRAHLQAHGFGIIRFSRDDRFDGTSPSIFFTASGHWRVLRPGESPTQQDLANTLGGEGVYAMNFIVYTAISGASFLGDYNSAWPGVRLSQEDFQSAKIILCGKGLEVVSLSHCTRLSGSLLLVR